MAKIIFILYGYGPQYVHMCRARMDNEVLLETI
jgi:hypothetical protein